jgi:hypothetical protein
MKQTTYHDSRGARDRSDAATSLRVPHRTSRAYSKAALLAAVMVSAFIMMLPGSASAAQNLPAWSIASTPLPTNFTPGDANDQYLIVATNSGGAPTDGNEVTVKVALPAGVTATSISGSETVDFTPMTCELVTLTCTLSGVTMPAEDSVSVNVGVSVSSEAAGTVDGGVEVTGGGASDASISSPTTFSSSPVGFGISPGSFTAQANNSDGTLATQAGAHPFSISTNFDFNSDASLFPAQRVKDIEVDLPVGLVGNPQAVPACSLTIFDRLGSFGYPDCPATSQVGTIMVESSLFSPTPFATSPTPVYNLQAEQGEAAAFGTIIAGVGVKLSATVRPGDQGVTVKVRNVTEASLLYGQRLVLWGVPADPSHDTTRACGFSISTCDYSVNSEVLPFLRNPTECGGPLTTTLRVDSWQEPDNTRTYTSTSPAITGCSRAPFNPSIVVSPSSTEAGVPTGLSVGLSLPQSENPYGIATADLKTASVTLPQGMSIDPASADGLQGCSDVQLAIGSDSEPTCPEASRIGTVQINTPLLKAPLTGSIYLGTQASDDPASGQMYRLFLVAQSLERGVSIKLAGSIVPDTATGQLSATFDNNPQLPFSSLKLQFKSGPRAPLSNPTTCGAKTTTATLTSWSGQTVEDQSSFDVVGCSAPNLFTPDLTAGLISPVAGTFSPFSLTVSRPDGQQDIRGLSVGLPPGVLADLGAVPLCPDAAAASASCGTASQIGKVTIAAGAGSAPLSVPQAGRAPTAVYLAGPYRGAPFSLSIVVPAQAGPFDLGTVVVRAALFVDEHDAHATIVSDPIPTILRGVPLKLQRLSVTIDREGFMFNPTSCEAQSVGATISSSQGTSVATSSHFQTANCSTLAFKPKLTASTQGKASKAEGASLTVAISAKGGPQPGGGEANIKKVEVQLPKQLPSRLTTLQKACSEAQFNTNPAACPHESNVGSAEARTPILANPLKGPAYLVSHGGAAFPDLEIVLQGEGITLILDGKTQITKGITYSRFQTVPDAPISSFRLSLPTGKFSILTANLPESAKYDLCTQGLQMPTRITGQNGAVIEQKTPIAISGCSTSMSIVSHRLNAKTVTLSVYVPAAGTLKVSGNGLRQATRTSKGRETLSLSLSQKRAGKLSTKLKLRFVPSRGKPQSRSLSTKFKK